MQVLYLYPCCTVLVAARQVQLLKKLQVPYSASIVPESLLY
jgi:hypothetical protein